MTLKALLDLMDEKYLKEVRIADSSAEISDLRFLSPLDGTLQGNVLYVAGEDTWIPAREQLQEKINVLYFGTPALELSWMGNVIFVEDSLQSREFLAKVQRHFLPETEELERIYELSKNIVRDKGIQEFLSCASEIMDSPLILFDSSLYCKAVSNRGTGQSGKAAESRRNQQSYKDLLIREARKVLERAELENKIDNEEMMAFYYSGELKNNMSVHKICINGFYIATLVIIEERRNLLKIGMRFQKILSGFIAQELQKATWYSDNCGDSRACFLVELLEEQYPNRKLIEKKLSILNYELKESLYMVVVRFNRQYMGNAGILLYYFQRILTGELYAIYKNRLVILMNRRDGEGIGTFAIDMLKKGGEKYHLLIGISREFHDLVDIRRFFNQAEKALDYGEIYVNKNWKHPLYYFQDYMLFEMLELVRKNADLNDFVNPRLLRLIRYDKEKETDYMTTLFEFLEHSQNIKQTADAMYVHKNTLIYRIEKIKSILEYDFSNSWENFTIYLSFRIVMILGMFTPVKKLEMEKKMKEKLK